VYLVTRRFSDGTQRVPGELVEGTGYKLLSKLISLRYLKETDVTAEASFRCQLCERLFIDQETLDRHYIECHPDEIEITDDDDGKTPDGDGKTGDGSNQPPKEDKPKSNKSSKKG